MAQKINNVAIVVCAVPPYGSGIGVNAFYQAKFLHAAGFNVTVFTPRYSWLKIVPSDIKIIYLKPLLAFGLAAVLPQLLWRLRTFDLIHLYYPFYGSVEIIWLAKIFASKKIKLVIHHQMEPVASGYKGLFFSWHNKIFLPLLAKIADKIITVSEDYAKNCHLKKYYLTQPEKFVAIPNGVDSSIFFPQPVYEVLRQGLKLSVDDQVVMFVGGLDSQHFFKGVDVLLRAFSKVTAPTSKLLIIGDGNLREAYQKQAEELGIAERVIFTGRIDNNLLPQYYNLAKVFVLPTTTNLSESFGIVTAEAQACGVPAIVSDWPGMRQTIEVGRTGFVFLPGDCLALAEKLNLLLTDESLRQRLSLAAASRARQLYGWDRVIRKIVEVYKQL